MVWGKAQGVAPLFNFPLVSKKPRYKTGQAVSRENHPPISNPARTNNVAYRKHGSRKSRIPAMYPYSTLVTLGRPTPWIRPLNSRPAGGSGFCTGRSVHFARLRLCAHVRLHSENRAAG